MGHHHLQTIDNNDQEKDGKSQYCVCSQRKQIQKLENKQVESVIQ